MDMSELQGAALGLNEIEANDAALETEAREWVNSSLVDDDDAGFDAGVFERQFNEAKTLRERETQKTE
jgi:hypothetical protein